MALGPIPRSKIKEYGQEDLMLSDGALDDFVAIIMKTDEAYLAALRTPTELPEQTRAPAPTSRKGPKARPRPISNKERNR